MSPFAMIGASVTMEDGHLLGARVHVPTWRDTGGSCGSQSDIAGVQACVIKIKRKGIFGYIILCGV